MISQNKTDVSIPWEGILLVISDAIGILVILTQYLFYIFEKGEFPGTGANVAIVGAIIITALFAIATYKGKKWAVVITLIFTIFSIIKYLLQFTPIALPIQLLILYASIKCTKHPYYNQL